MTESWSDLEWTL